MRKWIWTALLVLPLIAAGSMVYAHTGSGETSAADSQEWTCPLHCLFKHLHS